MGSLKEKELKTGKNTPQKQATKQNTHTKKTLKKKNHPRRTCIESRISKTQLLVTGRV